MVYTFKFIKGLEQVAARLDGQLSFGSSPHIGGQSINEEVLLERIQAVESELELILSQIYRTPLAHKHAILQEAVLDKVVRMTQATVPQMGAGSGVTQQLVAGVYESTVMLITAGHNIALPMPGLIPPQNMPGISNPQPIVLPGETLLGSGEQPDTLSRNDTVLGVRRWNTDNLGIDWGGGFGDRGRACGADRKAF